MIKHQWEKVARISLLGIYRRSPQPQGKPAAGRTFYVSGPRAINNMMELITNNQSGVNLVPMTGFHCFSEHMIAHYSDAIMDGLFTSRVLTDCYTGHMSLNFTKVILGANSLPHNF